jgi:hypothetical protein
MGGLWLPRWANRRMGLFKSWNRKWPAVQRATENKGFSGLLGGSFVSFGLILATLLTNAASAQPPAPAREWTPAQVREILDKTQTIRLAPSLAHFSPGERVAVTKLLEVGRIFQDVYEQQRHRNALTVRAALARRTDPLGRDLYTLYRLNQGPIATTLENKRPPSPSPTRLRGRTSIPGT